VKYLTNIEVRHRFLDIEIMVSRDDDKGVVDSPVGCRKM